ncbi:GFA family protein [Inquilinus sp.]|jgi:hypothetical protein|uniref:GFA family protein n=1 Tax=Inquilinus sp. TaxID=1932117 RepID=UPI00378416C8
MSDYPVLRPEPRLDADGTRLRQGGCSCGAVRFTLRGEPLVVAICHCFDCRKATGGVAMAFANWPRDAFTATGEVRAYRGRSFCPTCGSRPFHLAEGEDTVEILLGALDEAPGNLQPTRESWIIRREPWLAPVAGASQFDRDPA